MCAPSHHRKRKHMNKMLPIYGIPRHSARRVLLQQCRQLYSTRSATSEDETCTSDQPISSNACHDALKKGVTSRIVGFERSVDDAVEAFDTFQSVRNKWMHAHGLLRDGKARISPVYLPFWAFSCKITVEYRGSIGAKDQSSGQTVWKEMDDWHTLCHGEPVSFEQHPALQVYASYKYERQLGAAAALSPASSSATLSHARELTSEEARSLSAPAGAAGIAPSRVHRSQVLPPQAQQPLSSASRQTHSFRTGPGPGAARGPAPQSSQAHEAKEDKGEDTQNGNQAASAGPGSGLDSRTDGSSRTSSSSSSEWVEIHPPDMRQVVAWQLAWRALQAAKVHEATQLAIKQLGVADVQDMHVVMRVHERRAQLLYMPAYIAHYQHGHRYKQGTSTVIVPQMFYAAIGGTHSGSVAALAHMSPFKAQAFAAVCAGVVGPGALHALPSALSLGLPGPVEGLTLAVVAAALAGIWARAQPQAERNMAQRKQVVAERHFYAEYDSRETKTAAAAAAALWGTDSSAWGEAAAAGGSGPGGSASGAGPAPGSKAGEAADEYMQWLWMDNDWRRWEADEPWNWEERSRWAAAESIARTVSSRHVARQQYVLRSLADRDRRAAEAEAESARLRGSSGSASSRRRHRAGPGRHAGHHPHHALSVRHRDFLGYYKLLGLHGDDDEGVRGEVTTEEVKAAFKAAAMRAHPDRVAGEGGGEEAAQEAHVRFQKLQMAYDVLRDPEKRAAYDRGQLFTH